MALLITTMIYFKCKDLENRYLIKKGHTARTNTFRRTLHKKTTSEGYIVKKIEHKVSTTIYKTRKK